VEAIAARGLGKRYLVRRPRPTSAAEALSSLASWRARRARGEVWALRAVDLSVEQGEIVGVLGRNGAGKSTLLKLLSRVTQPTEGSFRVRGRVASLLDVGVGFHGELTGRENIYFSGALLGMKRGEIREKFDEIVEFAAVGRFIDEPVKRYSSGMYLRLGFAVCAHLQSEILLVDEVLSIGDLAFQKKCLGAMNGARKKGKTVLFVLHNLVALTGICTRAIWLEGGRLMASGRPKEVVAQYLKSLGQPARPVKGRGGGDVTIKAVNACGGSGENRLVLMGAELVVEATIRSEVRLRAVLGFWVENEDGIRVFDVSSEEAGLLLWLERGEQRVCCKVPSLPLLPGRYHVGAVATSAVGEILDEFPRAASFEVEAVAVLGCGRKAGIGRSLIFTRSTWEITGKHKETETLEKPWAKSSGPGVLEPAFPANHGAKEG